MSGGGTCSNMGAEVHEGRMEHALAPQGPCFPCTQIFLAPAAHNFFQTGDTPEHQPTSGAHAPMAHQYPVAEVLCWQPRDARSIHPLVHNTLPVRLH
jgi:hypothetical protein